MAERLVSRVLENLPAINSRSDEFAPELKNRKVNGMPITNCVSHRLTVIEISGIDLELLEAGPRAGLPLVHLHGYTDSCLSFGPLMAALPPDLWQIAVTQRGHGGSAKPVATYNSEVFAADLLALLDHLRLERVIVVGHCMGAFNALRFAIEHPERVSGLVLLNGFATMRSNPLIEELWHGTVAGISDPVDPEFVREFQAGTVERGVPDEFMDMIVSESLRVPATIWQTILASLRKEDLTDHLSRIAAPSLLLWGNRDTLLDRASQESLAAGIQGSRLIEIEGSGHSPHWEEPETVARHIEAFVRKLAISPAQAAA